MMAQAPGQAGDRWLPLVRTLQEVLIEQVPPPLVSPACVTSTPAHRLSRSGEIALGLTITLLAVVLYAQTLVANQRLSQRFAFCQPLRSGELAQNEAARQTQSLISNLSSATPSQKLLSRACSPSWRNTIGTTNQTNAVTCKVRNVRLVLFINP